MYMIAGLGLTLAQVPPTKVPATSTSKDMYEFWCTPARMVPVDPLHGSSILCQHHDLIAKMGAATVSGPHATGRSTAQCIVSIAAVAPHSEHRGHGGGHGEHPRATTAACRC